MPGAWDTYTPAGRRLAVRTPIIREKPGPRALADPAYTASGHGPRTAPALLLLEGGEDYEDAGEEWIVWTTANEVMAVSKALEEQGVQVKGSETTMVPTTPTEVSGADAKKVQRLIDRLEELDDVQDVYSTMDMTDEVIAALEEE